MPLFQPGGTDRPLPAVLLSGSLCLVADSCKMDVPSEDGFLLCLSFPSISLRSRPAVCHPAAALCKHRAAGKEGCKQERGSVGISNLCPGLQVSATLRAKVAHSFPSEAPAVSVVLLSYVGVINSLPHGYCCEVFTISQQVSPLTPGNHSKMHDSDFTGLASSSPPQVSPQSLLPRHFSLCPSQRFLI